MFIKRIKPWAIREHLVTDEAHYLNRRSFLRGSSLLIGGAALGLAGCDDGMQASDGARGGEGALSQTTGTSDFKDPTLDLYPAARNEAYTVTRDLSAESYTARYNNFYEFGSHKQIADAAQRMQIRPWTVTIDGLVEKEMVIDIDKLIRSMALEERIYRHRCVEAWAMTIPWTGFPMADFVRLAKPMSGAKYIRMETFKNSDWASGQKQVWYPWPYTEGVTMDEAMNEMAFLVTGVYGKPAANQFGAPLRLALPWKYGFKSIKSIVRLTFTSERPKSFWEELAPNEYGFWANVNPEVRHPRWSQANERLLGTNETVPTRIFNGYGEQVAHLYKDLGKTEVLYR